MRAVGISGYNASVSLDGSSLDHPGHQCVGQNRFTPLGWGVCRHYHLFHRAFIHQEADGVAVFFPQLETNFHCIISFELDGPWGKVLVSGGTWVSIHFLPKVMVEGQLCRVTLPSAACEPAKWSTLLLIH